MIRTLRTSRGEWSQRHGWLIRWQDRDSGSAGYGEVAPLSEFGSESMAEAGDFLQSVEGDLTEEQWREALSTAPPATAFGLWSAAFDASPQAGQAEACLAGLLTIGPKSAESVALLRASGMKTFKIKLGCESADREWNWLTAIIHTLKPGERLRLDPNQSWDQESWHFWQHHLGLFAEQIEFIEEPFPYDCAPSDMVRMAEESPVPLALDESLSRDGLSQWLELGWPGYWIIKPSLSGLPDRWLAALATRPEKVVLSSAFETGIGLSSLVRLTGPFNSVDHGFGTQDWFADPFRAPQDNGWIRTLRPAEMEKIWKDLPES